MSQPGELLVGKWDDRALSEALAHPVASSSLPPRWMYWATGLGTLMFFVAIGYTLMAGIGTWGNNIPVGWGFAITNFVFWIGIGHAGTFISAILLLANQKWRTSINRIAESMTLFALVQAAIFPALHLGRAWFAYWLVPYPATMEIWPQFLSVLTWDAAAVGTYTLVSILFWYLGLIPDLAMLRDRATSPRKRILYALLSLGFVGSSAQWKHFKSAQLILAGLATPLVISVHSIVSMDFATGILPGWHSTIFPPYFVAGAIFSGFAMVLTIVVPARKAFGLEPFITDRHLDLCAKLTLAMGLVVAYTYISETFFAWYSASGHERRMLLETRPAGPYAPLFWLMIFCNAVVIQLLWFRAVRARPWVLFVISLLINVGMWTERFVLIVTSEHRDFLPASWGMFLPSMTDAALVFGSFSFFFFLVLVLFRAVPFIPISELKEMRIEVTAQGGAHG